jgi:hypothetical protein
MKLDRVVCLIVTVAERDKTKREKMRTAKKKPREALLDERTQFIRYYCCGRNSARIQSSRWRARLCWRCWDAE